jgi:hypothetical protein
VLQAQDRSNRTEIKQPIKENINPVKQKKFKSSALLSLSPSQIIGGTAYPDPSLNFAPQSNLRAAGDVNKDGFQDFYYSVLTADEETEDLSDQILKTKLFYGSATGLSDENSDYFIDSTSIFKNGLRLIDDLTGDDIAEGFVLLDGTLTIYSDASGGNLTQIESIGILTGLSGQYNIESHGDFNGDGFNDILVFKNQIIATESNEYHVIYGGANLSDFTVKTIINDKVSDPSTFFQQVLYSDLDGNGTTEIVQLAGLESQNSAKIYTFQLDENDALSAIDTLDFPQTFGNASNFRSSVYTAVDLNKDGFKELLTFVFDRTYIFEYDTTSSENTFVVSNYDEFLGNGFSVIGDYNDDGFTDLLITGEPYNIVLGNADLDLDSFIPSLGEGSFSGITSLANNSGYSGDVNGDGIDDLVLEFSEDESYGYRTYFGNASASFSNTSEVEYSSPFLPYENSYYTLNAGDLNGDGTDDYAIEYYGNPNSDHAFPRLEVFYGGDLSKTTPDLVISHTERYQLSAPASGDFNGDGFSDIVINYGDETSGINIYLGGTNMDNVSDYELTFSEMFPENLGGSWSDVAFQAPANAGDINNDGIEDIIFSAHQVPNKTYVLYGGSDFSASPDLEIDFYATNFVAMQDFDGDGINDLALSSFFGNNTINVYSGFDSENGGSFSQDPSTVIFEPVNDGNRLLVYFGIKMASGDYNGDGFSDLVVSPFIHYDAANRAVGVESQYIYLGSSNPDSLADHKFGLKTALFTGAGNTTQTSTLLTQNLGELTTVPDQNGDGADEILVGTTPQNFGFETNAVVYFGASDITQINSEGDILFEAPNQRLGIGANNNNIISQTGHSAVGDFDGDSKNDFLFTQGSDPNFVKAPVYVFSSDEFSVGKEDEITQIKDFRLSQNYPNPFNPSTNISYSIPQTSNVSLKVYDVTGRLVSTLVNSRQASGTYDVSLNASAWASGIYFYRIVAGDYVKTRKLTLIK